MTAEGPYGTVDVPAPVTIMGNTGAMAAGNQVGGDLIQDVDIDVRVFPTMVVRALLESRLLDERSIRRHLTGYVEPPHLERASSVLEEEHAVILYGPEGSGRRTTALDLLFRRGLPIHALTLDQGDDRCDLHEERRLGYLVELRDATSETCATLLNWVEQARARDSRLVVMATPESVRHLPRELREIAISQALPDPFEVLERKIAARLPGEDAAWWRARPEFRDLLADAVPGDVARLVDLIEAAGEHGRRTPDEVRQAYRNWTELLDTKFPEIGIGDRILLVTLAFLQPAPARLIFEAADRLRERLSVKPDSGKGLALGVKQVAEKVEAQAEDGVLFFGRPAFAESVLDHVWREYPQATGDLLDWAIELGRTFSEESLISERLINALAHVAIQHADASVVRSTVEGWKDVPALRKVAAQLLAIAAESPRLGQPVRRWLYRWAYSPGTPTGQLLVTAEACARYGVAYPRNALTRLRHLAGRDDAKVADAVIQAVVELARRSELRNQVISEVTDWAGHSEPARRRTGCRAFLRLAGLREEAKDPFSVLLPYVGRWRRSLLGRGFRAAMIHPDTTAETQRVVAEWLDAAHTGTVAPHIVIDVLADAAREDIRYLPRLLQAATRWSDAGQEPTRDGLYHALVDAATAAAPSLAAHPDKKRGEP